jgi:hypothetical protein
MHVEQPHGMTQHSEVWIGLVEVGPHAGHDARFNGQGADTNMLALATSQAEYVEKVTATCNGDHLKVIEVDDVEPLRERMAEYEVTEEIVNLAGAALNGAVVRDTFFVYLTDGEDD